MNVCERTSLAEIEKVAIIEKELRNDVIGAGVDFRFEMIHFEQPIRGGRMPFRKASHPDPETAAVRMSAGLVESANEFDQIDRVLERVARFIVSNSNRPIAPERENVSNGSPGVSKKDRFDFFFVVADAGKVRDWIELCCVSNAFDEIVR